MFLLGLLNSKLFWFFICNTGYVLRGGYFTFKTNYLFPFPVPKPLDEDRETIKEIEQTVRILISISYDSHKYDFKVLENKIDTLVYKLYSFDTIDVSVINSL